MNILFLLIPGGLIVVVIALWFFFWAVKSEQFEDLDRQGANILFDDEHHQPTKPAMTDKTK